MTRGRSDIYDILTHLTFLYVEAEKIRRNSEDHKKRKRREWKMLEEIVAREKAGQEYNHEVAYTYLSTLLGRTYDETVAACQRFSMDHNVNSIFHITYWLGHLSTDEANDNVDREISFSWALREKIGHHYYGELWAQNIKNQLAKQQLFDRPIHIISANLHSVMNSLYAQMALKEGNEVQTMDALSRILSEEDAKGLQQKVKKYALEHGMTQVDDTSGTNISVQIFDTTLIDFTHLRAELSPNLEKIAAEKPVILVMDYAFGEQAYETMDELLKPFEKEGGRIPLSVISISVMGKAGILEGHKGDIMIPNAHVFEGTADNYPFSNDLSPTDFADGQLPVFSGPMITVMGTSLQNRDILRYFLRSSWRAAGLEMEGAPLSKSDSIGFQNQKKYCRGCSIEVCLLCFR